MGQVFGHIDPTKAGGQPVTAGTATTANTGLSSGQLRARQTLSAGLGGLGKGLQQMNGPMSSYSPPIQTPQQPMVDPSFFGVGRPRNPYFGS